MKIRTNVRTRERRVMNMKNEEYIECIVKMLQKINDNHKLKIIFEFVQRLFL